MRPDSGSRKHPFNLECQRRNRVDTLYTCRLLAGLEESWAVPQMQCVFASSSIPGTALGDGS